MSASLGPPTTRIFKQPTNHNSEGDPMLKEEIRGNAKDALELVDERAFQVLKQEIHAQLVESLDLAAVEHWEDDLLQDEVGRLTWDHIDAQRRGLPERVRTRLHQELQHELFGMGPLEPLMHDRSVSDILVNSPHEVFVERRGQIEPAPVIFADEAHLLRIIQRVVSRVGRRIDEVSPLVDARLPDGSRVNAVIPPLALGGPKLSIRRFQTEHFELQNLVKANALSQAMAQFLTAAVQARVSIMLSGGTGAGKTTLLDALSTAIPPTERIVTIEDSAELVLQHPHVVRLETRPANAEGAGAFTQRDLVRNSLRMRPDRILVGEVRGPEALDMLQAMNTGHEGSLTTIHANDTHDALARLEMMVAMTGFELPIEVVRQYIANGIGLVVHLARLKGGVRRVTRVTEITGMDKASYRLKDVFAFRRDGLDSEGRARGTFEATGIRPRCADLFYEAGVDFEESLFQRTSGD